MTDREDRKSLPPQVIFADPDEALYRDFEATRKYKRLKRANPKAAKFQAIKAIDVPTGTFAVADQVFDGLLDRVENGLEGVCFVIHGRTGAGKTHILRQLQKNPALQQFETAEGMQRPLVTLSAPAPCTLTTLGLRILTRLGYRPRKKLREHEVWDRVYANLAAQGVGILFIDEMHNVFTGRNHPERVKIAMTLKSLLVSESNPIQLVLAGLDDVKNFVLEHREVKRRSHFLALTALKLPQDEDNIKRFLRDLERQLGFPASGLAKGDMPQRFMSASRGLPGRMAYFAQEAAALAVAFGNRTITEKYLGEAYRRPYGGGRQDNPFLMANPARFKPSGQKKDPGEDEETRLWGDKLEDSDAAD
jgi:hypothetical protein